MEFENAACVKEITNIRYEIKVSILVRPIWVVKKERRLFNPAFSAVTLQSIQVAVRSRVQWKLQHIQQSAFYAQPMYSLNQPVLTHIVSFTARASGSSEVPIYLPTFQNLQLTSYLCPNFGLQSPTSFWDSQLPGEQLPSSHSSEAPIYLTFFTDSTITLNLTALRLYNIWRL